MSPGVEEAIDAWRMSAMLATLWLEQPASRGVDRETLEQEVANPTHAVTTRDSSYSIWRDVRPWDTQCVGVWPGVSGKLEAVSLFAVQISLVMG